MILLLQGCFSETEVKGIKEVAELYGGRVTYQKSVGTSGKYFKVKISDTDSPLLLDNTMELAAHNIAMMVFAEFSEKERSEYDGIQIELNNPDATITRKVDRVLIEQLLKQRDAYKKEIPLVISGDYRNYYNKLGSNITSHYSIDSFLALTDDISVKMGPVKAELLELGVDTAVLNDTAYAFFVTIYKAANDSSQLLTKTAYLLNEESDHIFGFNFKLLNN